jgi:hypothetical protein
VKEPTARDVVLAASQKFETVMDPYTGEIATLFVVVRAMLQAMTSEQRAAVMEKIK